MPSQTPPPLPMLKSVTFPIETSKQRSVLATAIVFAILPVIAVCLRFAAHRVANRKLSWSDYCIAAAAVFAVALESVSITGVIHGGIGFAHTAEIVETYGMEPVVLLLKLLIPLQFLWVLSLAFCKFSILLLYTQVFQVTSLIWAARVLMVIITLWAIATILAGVLICTPFSMNWNQAQPGGHCGNEVASFQGTGIINLVTDVCVLLLPMPHLFKLRLALYKRATLMGVFAVGFMVCVISGFRISVLSTMNFADITYTIPLANIFSGVEPSVAVILACVPLLRPLIKREGSTKGGSSAYPTYGSENSRRTDTNRNEFQPLEDDSSQYHLRPMGVKHQADIKTASRGTNDPSDDDSDLGVQKTDGLSPRERMGGIEVRKEWAVSERGHSAGR